MLKAQGKPVKDHPVIDQLVRVRAIIEKTKPIEKKLSYQIDKLVRSANLGTIDSILFPYNMLMLIHLL